MNKMARLAVLVAGLALLAGTAPMAMANHPDHDDPPTPIVAGIPKAECVVGPGSTVTIEPGVGPHDPSGHGGHNHYEFVGTTIICNGPDQNLAGTYRVTASGGTDGHFADPTDPNNHPAHAFNAHHGEDCESGWSADTQAPGTIEVTRIDPADGKHATGSVSFVRIGTAVEAWGTLNWDDEEKKPDRFHAELQFTPTSGTCTEGDPITDALLNGVATIFN